MISVKIILVYAVMLALFTCEWCEPGPTIQEQVDAFNLAGWQLFTESEFAAALEEFNNGLILDPVNSSGNAGRGWSLLMLDDEDQDMIVAALEAGATGPSTGRWQEHSWCGLAVVKLNQLLYSAADSLAALVLAANSGYVFTYREQIDWRDLLVIQAQALFFIVDYSGAWLAIKPLLAETDSPVSFPNGDLDPAVSSTWTIDVTGTANGTDFARYEFALYEIALAEVISILTEEYR